jgi:hypothetical protein
VSLELGGSNDATNLWPEVPPSPNPKDQVEDTLHDAVCAGQVSLAAAQNAIASDWMTAEARLGLGRPTPVAPGSPAGASTPPAASSRKPPPATGGGCYPRSDEGTCYRPGEYCRDPDHGVTGRAADGEPIVCRDNGGWRWEPA